MGVVLAIMLAVMVLLGAATYLKLRASASGCVEPPRCVACESTQLDNLAKAVYRCQTCGYEGGEGRAAWLREQKRAQWEGLSSFQRRELSERKLHEARELLTRALSELEFAQQRMGGLLPGGGGGLLKAYAREVMNEVQPQALRAFKAVIQGRELLEDAAWLKGQTQNLAHNERSQELPDSMWDGAFALPVEGVRSSLEQTKKEAYELMRVQRNMSLK
ncbi:MAG: hypothetical protein AAFS10_01995 [Myxococcota bacterium]